MFILATVIDAVNYDIPVLGQSMPLVPFTENQEQALADKCFTHLLHTLGLEFPSPLTVAYPRVPSAWSPAVIWSKAELLAPIKKGEAWFTVNTLCYLCLTSLSSFLLFNTNNLCELSL